MTPPKKEKIIPPVTPPEDPRMDLLLQAHERGNNIAQTALEAHARMIDKMDEPDDINIEVNVNGDAEKVTIVGPKGDQGAEGKEGPAGKEPNIEEIVSKVLALITKPKDGKTPVKGVDYYTDADRAELIKELVPFFPKGRVGASGRAGKDAEVDYEKIAQMVQTMMPKVKESSAKPITATEIMNMIKGKISYEDLTDKPTFLNRGKQASKTTSLSELDDVDLSLATKNAKGQYVIEPAASAGAVTSVNGKTGAVVLSASDVSAPTGSGTSTGTNTGDQDLSSYETSSHASSTYVAKTVTVNGHALSSNVSVTAADVGAPSGSGTSTGSNTGDQDLSSLVPNTRTINGHALSSNVTVSASDLSLGNVDNTSDATKNAASVTLTNKRWTKRVLALSANSATPTINTDLYDVVHITAQTAAITSFTTNLTGTPVDGDTLRMSVTGTTSIALTFGTSFESSGTISLPPSTSGTTRLDIGFFWNTETSKWRLQGTS